MEFLVLMLISMTISIAVAELTAVTPPDKKSKGIDQFKFPTVSADRSVPVVVGDVFIEAPNVIWYGDFRKKAIKEKVKVSMLQSKKVTVGHQYFIGMEMALCWGPVDSISEIWFGDKLAWSGTQGEGLFEVSSQELFGPKGEGGGVFAICDLKLGQDSQAPSSYMTSQVGEAYNHKGLAKLIWTGPSYAIPPEVGTPVFDVFANRFDFPVAYPMSGLLTENAQIKPIKIRVTSLPSFLNSGFHDINGTANPAEVIYSILLGKYINLIGESVVPAVQTSIIDIPNFLEVAETLHTEEMGISAQWQTGTPPETLISDVMRHIDGSLVEDPATGKLRIILAREDFDSETLVVLDETNCTVKDFGRRALSATVNEVVATFTDSANEFKPTPVKAQDIGNMFAQNNHSPTDLDLLLFNDPIVVNQRAQSHLRQMSSVLARMQIEADSTAWQFGPATVFKLNWPPLGIANMNCRVVSVKRGDIRNRKITLEVIEDVFSLGTSLYSDTIPSEWQAIHNPPTDVALKRMFETPLKLLDDRGGEQVTVLAAAPTQDTYEFDVNVKKNNGSYETQLEQMIFLDTETLTEPYSRYTAAVDPVGFVASGLISEFYNDISADDVKVLQTNWFMIDDEIMAARNVTLNSDGTVLYYNVYRGLLDTVPANHDSGARVWPLQDAAQLPDVYDSVAIDTVRIKLQPSTVLGQLPVADASEIYVLTYGRSLRPYAPGNIRIAGDFIPSIVDGDTVIEWDARDRNDTVVRQQDDANDTSEAGANVNLQIWNETGTTLLHQNTNATSPYTYTAAQEISDAGSLQTKLTIRIKSIRSGVSSFQEHSIDVDKYIEIIILRGLPFRINNLAPDAYWMMDTPAGTVVNDATDNGRSMNFTGSLTLNQPPLTALNPEKKSVIVGANGYGEVPTGTWLQNENMTIFMIAQVESANNITGNNILMSCHSSSNSYNGWNLRLSSGFLGLNLKGASSGQNVTVFSSVAFPVGEPVYIGIFFAPNGGTAYVYQNETIVITIPVGITWSIGAYPLRINKAADTFWDTTTINYDDIAIFTNGITQSEYLALIDETGVDLTARYWASLNNSDPLIDEGIFLNNMVVSGVTGSEKAGVFNGANSYANFTGNPAPFNTPNWTFAAKIKTVGANDETIVSMSDESTSAGSPTMWNVDTQGGAVRFGGREGQGVSWQQILGTTDVTDDTWHYIAVTKEGITAKVWVDGVEEASGDIVPSGGWTFPGDAGPTFGRLWKGDLGFGNFYDGSIAEALFYNRVLSGAEIVALMTADYSAP